MNYLIKDQLKLNKQFLDSTKNKIIRMQCQEINYKYHNFADIHTYIYKRIKTKFAGENKITA